jgi:hypothetical protein
MKTSSKVFLSLALFVVLSMGTLVAHSLSPKVPPTDPCNDSCDGNPE